MGLNLGFGSVLGCTCTLIATPTKQESPVMRCETLLAPDSGGEGGLRRRRQGSPRPASPDLAALGHAGAIDVQAAVAPGVFGKAADPLVALAQRAGVARRNDAVATDA
jgi:hypothetical protein